MMTIFKSVILIYYDDDSNYFYSPTSSESANRSGRKENVIHVSSHLVACDTDSKKELGGK